MRPTQILLLILVTLLFAGSATSSSFDTPAYQEATCHTSDTFDSHEGDNDANTAISSHSYIAWSKKGLLIGKAFASPAQWKRARIILSPLTPQAPPA